MGDRSAVSCVDTGQLQVSGLAPGRPGCADQQGRHRFLSCAGCAMAAFAVESQLDEIRPPPGPGPIALRQQNVTLEGDPLPNLQPQPPVGAKQVLAALAKHPAWSDPPPRAGDDGLLRGRGLLWGAGSRPGAFSALAYPGGDARSAWSWPRWIDGRSPASPDRGRGLGVSAGRSL